MNFKSWLFANRVNTGDIPRSDKLTNIWWLRHVENNDTLVIHNITPSTLENIELDLYSIKNEFFSVHIDDLDIGIAREVPFAKMIQQSGNSFSGKINKLCVRSIQGEQHFQAIGNRFLPLPLESD